MIKENKDFREITNVVKIYDSENARDYIYSTCIRMRPDIYNKYGCIIWQVCGDKILPFVKNILFDNCVKYWGLEMEENDEGSWETPISIEVDTHKKGAFTIKNGHQIILKKIPPIKHIQ